MDGVREESWQGDDREEKGWGGTSGGRDGGVGRGESTFARRPRTWYVRL